MKPQEVQEKNRPPSGSESREYMQAWRCLSSWAYTGCHVCAVSPVSPKSYQLLCICRSVGMSSVFLTHGSLVVVPVQWL